MSPQFVVVGPVRSLLTLQKEEQLRLGASWNQLRAEKVIFAIGKDPEEEALSRELGWNWLPLPALPDGSILLADALEELSKHFKGSRFLVADFSCSFELSPDVILSQVALNEGNYFGVAGSAGPPEQGKDGAGKDGAEWRSAFLAFPVDLFSFHPHHYVADTSIESWYRIECLRRDIPFIDFTELLSPKCHQSGASEESESQQKFFEQGIVVRPFSAKDFTHAATLEGETLKISELSSARREPTDGELHRLCSALIAEIQLCVGTGRGESAIKRFNYLNTYFPNFRPDSVRYYEALLAYGRGDRDRALTLLSEINDEPQAVYDTSALRFRIACEDELRALLPSG